MIASPQSVRVKAEISVIHVGVAQEQRCVYGLLGRISDEPCSIQRNSTLAMMDAPTLLPCGGMEAADYHGTDPHLPLRVTMETNVIRGESPSTVCHPTFKEIA